MAIRILTDKEKEEIIGMLLSELSNEEYGGYIPMDRMTSIYYVVNIILETYQIPLTQLNILIYEYEKPITMEEIRKKGMR